MNYNDYIRLSLETHLFFDRIMKEHSLFIDLSLPDKNQDLKSRAKTFEDAFDQILQRVVRLSNHHISNAVLESGEIVTKNTLDAEAMMDHLFSTKINMNVTREEMNLKSGSFTVDRKMIGEVNDINKHTLPLIEDFIRFKNDVLSKVLSCKIYTSNYPSLINHIINEAKMYYDILTRIDRGQGLGKNMLHDQEVFWNEIMKEHAEFIRGLLDPSEKNLILTADKFAEEYQIITKRYFNDPVYLTSASLKETTNFRDFKIKGEEGILNCRIKSIITPLLSDHVLREANHYLRILKGL